MTAQTHDKVNLQGKEYDLVGINGLELFNPEKLGIKPTGRVTSCGRGFVCHYVFIEKILMLDKLQMSYGHLGRTRFTHKRCPEINGIAPIFTKDRDTGFNNVYENLNLKIEFTGRILIADDYIYKLAVNMGFHPAWKYITVYELKFENGQVTNTQDISPKMEEIREEMIKQPLEPGLDVGFREIARWVNSTFSLTYSFDNGEYKLNIGKEPDEDFPSLESLGRLPDDLDEPDDE